MKLSVLLLASGLALSAPLLAAPEPTGEMMAHTCAACHGTYGRVEGVAFAPLAGMDRNEFTQAMREFRSGARPSTLMKNVANGFSDTELEAMAEFFAGQSVK